MALPVNAFRHALLEGQVVQHGVFVTIPDATVADLCASVGFDWILLDAEHGVTDPRSVLAQVWAVEARGVSAVVRVPGHDARLIKPYLDAGVQTLLVPMVETPEEARTAARAVSYPPNGIRGVASTRAAAWGGISNYFARARDEIFLIVQIESRRALEQVNEIAAVEGVDAVFVGPSDLAASLGHIGEPHHPDVVAAVRHIINVASVRQVPVGVFASKPELANEYREAGATFVACGVDAVLFARSLSETLATYRNT